MNARCIGVTGTHSTGKTTFINEVTCHLREKELTVSVVTDLASTAASKGFPILHEHNEESTLWLMTHGISSELEQSLFNDVVIVDRPVIDAVGYYLAAMEITNRTIRTSYLDMLYCIASEWLRRYEFIFKTNLNPQVPLGAGRNNDHKFRALADQKITEALAYIEIDYIDMSHQPSEAYLQLVTNSFSCRI